MKTFYSSQEIEDLARQGAHELVVDDGIVLTDLARQTAALLGLRLVASTRPPTSPAGDPSPRPNPSREAVGGMSRAAGEGVVAPIPAKPRGCQHGPLGERPVSTAPTLSAASTAGPGNGKVVDDLVGLVKQMSKR